MEARTLAELAVVRLERLGGLLVSDELVDSRADLLHLLEVGHLHRLRERLGGHLAGRTPLDHEKQLPDDVGPAVVHEVFRGEATPDTRVLKLSIRCFCHPGSSDAAHSGSVGRFARTSIDDGVRWNTYRCSAVSPR